MIRKYGLLLVLILCIPTITFAAEIKRYAKPIKKQTYMPRSAVKESNQLPKRTIQEIEPERQPIAIATSIHPKYAEPDEPSTEKKKKKKDKEPNPLVPIAVGTTVIGGTLIATNVAKINIVKAECLAKNDDKEGMSGKIKQGETYHVYHKKQCLECTTKTKDKNPDGCEKIKQQIEWYNKKDRS